MKNIWQVAILLLSLVMPFSDVFAEQKNKAINLAYFKKAS
jgi:hypothetical protein